MKKITYTLLISLMLFVSACAVRPPTQIGPAGQATTDENTVPLQVQLLLGTLKLNETDLAVTAEQAAVLLPLWSDFKTISMSMGPPPGGPGQTQNQAQSTDAETQAEIDALVAQIQAAMTPEQIKAIAAMEITAETAMTLMQEQGLMMRGPGGQAPQGPPPGDGRQAPTGNQTPGDGQMPAPPSGDNAGPPPGDGQAFAGGQPPGDMPGSPPGGQGPAGGMVPPPVIDALLQSLSQISGTEIAATTSQGPGEPLTGGPPSGEPPSGEPSSGEPPAAADTVSGSMAGAYTLDSGSETLGDQSFTATETDQSAIYVTNGGSLTLTGATITTSGDTSSQDSSSFYGLNAAVLAEAGSTINLSDSTISTTGTGANGAFAAGENAVVNLSNITIDATADGGHGVMATLGGVMTLTDVDITTAGPHSGAIATDRGSGTITVSGGNVTTSGADSPAIYSTGDISVSGGVYTAIGAEAAVIEGSNSITLNDVDLSSTYENKWGVMIYQSFSGDAEGGEGIFTMTGGSLAYTSPTGPLFYVTNSTGYINLTGVDVTAASGVLLQAAANDRWGTSGANGGTIVLTADNQTLSGDMVAVAIGSINATLQNGSTLTGAINADNTAAEINLTLDATSTWNVTADSYLTCLNDADGISGTSISNITGNGYTVYYDSAACSALGGQTYTLSGGGSLQPMN